MGIVRLPLVKCDYGSLTSEFSMGIPVGLRAPDIPVPIQMKKSPF